MKCYLQRGRFRVVNSGYGTYHVQVRTMDKTWRSFDSFDYLSNARAFVKAMHAAESGCEKFYGA